MELEANVQDGLGSQSCGGVTLRSKQKEAVMAARGKNEAAEGELDTLAGVLCEATGPDKNSLSGQDALKDGEAGEKAGSSCEEIAVGDA